MLLEIQAENTRREELPKLKLPLAGRDGGVEIVFVDGLGPVKSSVSSTPYANLPGEYIQNSRVGMRNIVLTLELHPSYSTGEDVQQVREKLYSYFSPGGEIDLMFLTTVRNYKIKGTIESFDAPLFVQVPRVQISILCPDPYFDLWTPGESGPTVTAEGTVVNGAVFQITNRGQSYSGMEMSFNKEASLVETDEFIVSVENGIDRPLHVLDEGEEYRAGSYVFNSMHGLKEVRSGPKNLMMSIVYGSGWPRLAPGINNVRILFPGGITNNILWKALFYERYLGL